MTRTRRIAVVAWAAVLAASGWIVLRTPVKTDLTGFLPAAATPAQQLLLNQLQEGVASRVILIAIEGGEPKALAQMSRKLAEKLNASGLFAHVNNGDAQVLEEVREVLFRHRYLLSPGVTAERFSAAALRNALQDDLALLASSAGSFVKDTLPRDPTGELLRILPRLASSGGPQSEHGVWFSSDRKRALMLAETIAPGSDLDRQQHAIETIRKSFAEIPGSAELLLSGPGVFAQEARQTIEREAFWLSLAATLLVVLILVSIYRSPVPVVLTALPAATGLSVGIASVALGFGVVHGITLGFGATLIGETVDYPSYVFTHNARGERLAQTLERIWPTLKLAVLTTIFGACAMLASSFTGLSQLGLLTASGVLAAGLATRFVLPAIAGQASYRVRLVPVEAFTAVAALTRYRLVIVIAIALAAAVLLSKRDEIWDDDIANLSPVSQAAKDLDQQLRAEMGAPDVRYLFVVEGATREDALVASEQKIAWLESLIASGTISGYELAAAFLPSIETQEARKAALPDAEMLERNLAEASKGMPFRAGLFAPFLEDVRQAKASRPVDESALSGTALALKTNSLLFENGGVWVALIPLIEISDTQKLKGLAQSEPGIWLLDLKGESNRMIASYRTESLRYIAGGVAAIFIVLALGLNVPSALWVFTPVAAAVIVSFGILVAIGHRLTLFHLVSLLLVVGIGLNYSLFFNRPGAEIEERRRTLTSLLVCSMTTISAFGCLAFSANPVLRAIGTTVAMGAALSLLCAAVLAKR